MTHEGLLDAPPPRDDIGLGRVHFVGVGGVGMSGIARIVRARGHLTTGSDVRDDRRIAALRAYGIDIHIGHDAAHVHGADTVVVTPSAIRNDNPEVVEARRLGLPILARAAVLAALMGGRTGVAVSGSHGKTTTTSMIAVAMQHCGLDPSFAIGADLHEPGSNAHHGQGEYFLAEADESDGSFLLLRPHGAIVTNVDLDHPAKYPTQEAYEAAFARFLECIDGDGFLVTCVDDPGCRRLADAARARGLQVVTYGEAEDADVRCLDIELAGLGSAFTVQHGGRRRGSVRLRVPGRHNVWNATGALAVCLVLDLPLAECVRGLESFSGARRRFEFKGEASGVRVYDDYCVHHAEWGVVIRTAKVAAAPHGRVIAVCQPHRYSRTAMFSREYAVNAALADEVVLMEVYPEFEDPIPGVTGSAVAAMIDLPAERVHFEPSWSRVPALAASLARPGDVIVTIGGGDVTMIGPEILRELRSRSGGLSADDDTADVG